MLNLGDLANPDRVCAEVDLTDRDLGMSLSLFRKMITIRRAEELIAGLIESNEARCPCHLAIGQEASAVGVVHLLRPTDKIFGAHRSHGHFLGIDAPAFELFAEILGRDAGCSRGFGGSMHLRAPDLGLVGTVPIVGATIPMAVGAALAGKLAGDSSVAVAFFGDGATEEGVFHESLNLAATLEAPVLFAIENNLYASHLHISERQRFSSTSRFAEVHGVDSETVDGNDVIAVYEAAERLIRQSRVTHKPALLEMVTYRWRGHVGSSEDVDVGVERKHNLAAWKKFDPIYRLESAILKKWSGSEGEILSVRNGVETYLADSLDRARQSPWPRRGRTMEVVFPSGGSQ